jgi:glycosyltransferase involved in cell wall biosynthesis
METLPDVNQYVASSTSSWPRISIVIPSYNQGAYVESAIRSVIDQRYPDVELIIMDGCSSDNTVDVIRKYQSRVAYWESVRDNGQSHAINKGLRRVTGEIWAYLNTDDYYTEGVFFDVAREFKRRNRLWVTGQAEYFNESGTVEKLTPVQYPYFSQALLRWENPRATAIQPSTFYRTEVIDRFGYFDESLHYCMDFEYNLRLQAQQKRPAEVPRVLCRARLHPASKTVSEGSRAFIREDITIVKRFLSAVPDDERAEVEEKLRQHELTYLLSQIDSPSFQIIFKNPRLLFSRRFWGKLSSK